MVPDDREEPLAPNEIDFYTFFLEGQGNPPYLMGIDDDQLRAIQNDLRERLQARDEARGQLPKNCENLNRNMNLPMPNFLNILSGIRVIGTIC